MKLDLNSKTAIREAAADWIGQQLDRAILAEQAAQPRRDYLGGSYIGGECERAIQLQYLGEPVDPGREFPANTLRIFARGHQMEDMVAAWLRSAGFDLKTHGADGRQFGFVSGGGKFKGHADGVVVGWTGEGDSPVEFPALWENKALNAKSWKSLKAHGVRKSKPVYWSQMMLYQFHLGLTDHPAVFTFVNADTMEIGIELVPFDPEECQRLIDRAVRIIRATEAQELLPRGASDPESFTCRFCDWKEKCWS